MAEEEAGGAGRVVGGANAREIRMVPRPTPSDGRGDRAGASGVGPAPPPCSAR